MAPLISLNSQQQHTLVVAGTAAAAAIATYKLFNASAGASSRGTAAHAASKLKPTQRGDDACYLNPSAELFAQQAFTRLIAAFGPDGLNATKTGAGAMIASPSRPEDRLNKELENDNYYYQWPRDSGICVRMLVRRWVRALEGRQVGVDGGRDWLASALRRMRNGESIAGREPGVPALSNSGSKSQQQHGESAAEIEKIIHDFAKMNLHLQKMPNPAGTFETGGLGEAKFEVDGTPFQADWGRPQKDMTLRALALLSYATHVLDHVDEKHPSYAFVFDYLYAKPGSKNAANTAENHCIINADLEYTCREWKYAGYEPWEEVNAGYEDEASRPQGAVGGHFFVLMVQRQALLFGARFAKRVGDTASAEKWAAAGKEIGEALEHFWNPEGKLDLEGDGKDGPLPEEAWNDARRHLRTIPQELLHRPHIVPTLHRLNGQQKPTQTDVQTLLGFTLGGDGTWFPLGDGDSADDTWAPWSDRALASLDRIVEVFKIVYELNAGRDTTRDGVMCGRYPEDIYDGKQTSVGHPWFICTHQIVETIALAANRFADTGRFTPTEFSLRFFRRFHPALQAGKTYRKAIDSEFETTLRGMRAMAHAYLRTARSFAGPEGRMDEQIDRVTERMRGARELTWSYSSLMSAWDALNMEGPDVKTQ